MYEQQKKYVCRYCSSINLANDNLDTYTPYEKGYWCLNCETFNFFNSHIDYSDPKLILESKDSNTSQKEKSPSINLRKQISPLRYPGGKSRLINFLYYNFDFTKKTFIELYCGGAAVGLSFLFSGLVEKLILNDLDKGVYSLFNIILNNPYDLINKINTTKPTQELFNYYRDMIKNDYQYNYNEELEIAFGFLLVNRCAFSGIYNANSLSKITSRWNPETLKKRILKIYEYRNKITLYNMDGVELLEELYWDSNNLIFIDPPYVTKGSKLYHCYYNSNDHVNLANMIRSLTLEFPNCADIVITYDNHKMIYELYEDVTSIKVIPRYYSISNK